MKQLLLFLAFLLPICVFSQQKGTVRINEIMADPNGLTAFPKTEYVELCNRTDMPILLEGWVFLYGDKATSLASISLPARGYVVLYDADDEISVDAPGLGMPLEDFPRNLANTGKTLSLKNASNELIDRITYEKATPGIAWERKGEYLYLSKDERGGTPGSENSHPETEPSDPEKPDEPQVLPELIAIQPLSESVFQLRYDLPVDISEAVCSLSGIGEASRMNYADDTWKNVNISFDERLEIGVDYDLSCSGLMDLEGNEIPESSTTIRLEYEEEPDDPAKPDTPSFPSGSIRINEIMPDPKGQVSFPETEYVELHNTTDQPIELNGWSFVYGGKSTTLTSLSLGGDGYVVLYRSGRNIYIDDPGQGMPLDKFPASLVNTGKELALLDPSGKEIDRISYDKAKAGVAWERSESGFYLSMDERGGTPGSANSSPEVEPEEPELPDKPDIPTDILVSSGEIVFNELLPDPYPEGSEYIEFYNRSDRALPLSGLSVATRRSDGTLSTRYPLSSIVSLLEPKGYLVLTKSVEGVSDFYLVPSPDALHELKLPVLANTSATLVLLRTEDNTVIDEIRYASTWHDPSVKNEKGVSLERIDPEGDTQDEKNWTSAAAPAGYGTPGYQNSQYGKRDEGEATGMEPPVYSETTKEYTISYHLAEPGYTCRAWVFDVSGKRICEVVDHELLGVEGELTWNGLAGNGSKVRAGVYIFYAELVHPQGEVERCKKVFLVR